MHKLVAPPIRLVVALLLVAVPILAQAECGWLLMVPPGGENDFRRGRARPLLEWRQEAAYDTAVACEDGKARKTQFWMKTSQDAGEPTEQRENVMFYWHSARCLPASQVPVR